MDIIGKILASNIKRLRKSKNWTQNDLALEAGISFRGLQDIETGKRNPRPDTLSAIAGALKISETDLYKDPSIHNPMPKDEIQKEAQKFLSLEEQTKVLKQAAREAIREEFGSAGDHSPIPMVEKNPDPKSDDKSRQEGEEHIIGAPRVRGKVSGGQTPSQNHHGNSGDKGENLSEKTTKHSPLSRNQLISLLGAYFSHDLASEISEKILSQLKSQMTTGSIPLNKDEHSIVRMFQGLSDEGQDYMLKRFRFALKKFPRSAKGSK